jgi:hypothetical protein
MGEATGAAADCCATKKGWGSCKGKHQNAVHGRLQHNCILLQEYFDPNPTYNYKYFCHHFRMCHCVFDHLLNAVVAHNRYFVQKKDNLAVPGFSPHQILTCALCFLAYSTSADQLDEYIRMAETTVLETVSFFCSAIIACFSDTYLCSPTVAD